MQPALGEHGVVRGDVGLRHRRRDVVGQAGRDRGDVPLMHHYPVGQPAAADEAEHPVADVPRADGVPGGGHHARDLQAGDVPRRPRRRGVVSMPLRHVGPVHASEPGGHEDLVGRGNRVGARGDGDDLVSPGPGERHGSHWLSSAARVR